MANRRNHLHDTFRMTPVDETLFNKSELPSHKITVKILLKSVSLVLKDLNRQLKTDNMEASRDGNNKNAIVVQGIPYENYGEQEVLRTVQKFDRGASIIR